MREYAYLNARVSILADRLLSEARLTELLNQPLGTSTKNGDFNEWLNDETISLNRIEQVWLMRMLTDFKILVRPLSGAARDFLMYWFHKCDIANLKTIVRGKIAGLETTTVSAQLLNLEPLTTLPVETLLHTEDINELLRHLENSAYSDIAREARRVFEKEHQLYSLDAAIDRHYLLGLLQKGRTLDRTQYQYLRPLLSVFMDRFNLLWLLRYRFAYHLSAAETYYLLIPTSFRLHRQLLQRLVELNSVTEVLAHLPAPFYHLLADADNLFTIDQRLIITVRQTAQSTLKRHSFTLAKTFAYVLLREMEMRRVMAILKGKRLKLKQNMIALAAEYSSTLFA